MAKEMMGMDYSIASKDPEMDTELDQGEDSLSGDDND
jgi:hypothetical protein